MHRSRPMRSTSCSCRCSVSFLRDLERPSKPLLVGIGYALQEIEPIEPQDWDVRLDYVATERELIDCTDAES
jgi:5-formyltetrahydrofolate cyclo-ligase